MIIIFQMFQDNSLQDNHQISNMKSAFRPITCVRMGAKIEEKPNTQNQNDLVLKSMRQLSYTSVEKHLNNDGETWHRAQIEKLFKLYDYYGPQWKIMSQQMASRTANNLKNRFYTVLRNLIKLLFRKKSDSCPKLPGEIPSKDLSRLYDGKQDYQQFHNFIPTLLQQINYNLESQNIDIVVKKYSMEIIKIYQVIYGERAIAIQEESKIVHKKSDQLATNYISSSVSLQKPGEIQKVNQHPSFISIVSQPEKGVIQQPSDCFYFFFFNPADFYVSQRV